MTGLLLLGLAATFQGVVEVEDDHVHIQGERGRVRLGLSPEHQELRFLDSCTVWVQGPRLGRRLFVRDWTVLAAADGSAPFVGVLREHGANLVVDDRNSGATYVLVGAEGLRVYAGEPVLIIGFVVGPNMVQVMGWQVLADE